MLEVFLAFLRLGLTSFGGPIAHLGYFRAEFVARKQWLAEARFAETVALAQMLPGPSSSQAGMMIGYFRAGWLGGLAAWCAFTLPSALALTIFALWVHGSGAVTDRGWIHGLLLAAVAVVAQAVVGMRATLAPDLARTALAFGAAVLALLFPSSLTQVSIIAAGAVAGRVWFARKTEEVTAPLAPRAKTHNAFIALALFFAILIVLPIVRNVAHSDALALFDAFFRVGSFVFGGGHVVLPLLQTAVVTPGWVTPGDFIAGYGAAQAVPGPLFTFSAYLGAINHTSANGWTGAAIALVAIFLPSAFLLSAALPFWDRLRAHDAFRPALYGINAAVVGLLLAAFVSPVWTSAVHAPIDVVIAIGAYVLLAVKWPPWSVVLACAIAAQLTTVGSGLR